MASYEGTIEIPMDEFWRWVLKHAPNQHAEIAFGPPRVNIDNHTVEISFAASEETDPRTWADRPLAVRQWDELQKTPND